MSYNLPGEINPFEAPRAGIGEEALYVDLADEDSDKLRSYHIGHEANIKSLGHLNYLLAFFWGIFVFVAALMASGVIPQPPNQRNDPDPTMQRVIMAAGAMFYLILAIINGALGFGLTHLQVWARWTTLVFTSLAILYLAFMGILVAAVFSPATGVTMLGIGGIILGFVMYLLLIRKSGVVFSSEYREVIRKTPHIKQKTSIIVKVLLAVFLAVIGIGIVAAFFGNGR